MRWLSLGVAAVLFLATEREALAWGTKAHRIVALLAEYHLTAEAKAQVRSLLAGEEGNGLAAISTWADAIRINPEFRFSARGHFLTIPLSATGGDLTQYCPGDDCITASLATVGRAVADRSLDPARRAAALKFLVHLMADIHHPMHCADNQDSGGNRVRVLYGGQATNLHAAWDGALVESLPGSEEELARQINAGITSAQRSAWSPGDPASWAWESFGIAKSVAYTSALRNPGTEPVDLSPAYVTAAHKVIRQQLAKAGVRLAAQLNSRLGAGDPRNISTWLYPNGQSGADPGTRAAQRETDGPPPAAGAPGRVAEDTQHARLRIIAVVLATALLAGLAMWRVLESRRRRVFVCYRRNTTQADAGRIFDRLSASFGSKNVFRDLDSIDPGADFVEAIDDRLSRCDVVVAVIGPGWASDSRLQLADDYVRRELAHALEANIPVIPVLVQNASMPVAVDLPADLQRLARRNGMPVADHLFTPSMEALTAAIRKIPPRTNQETPVRKRQEAAS